MAFHTFHAYRVYPLSYVYRSSKRLLRLSLLLLACLTYFDLEGVSVYFV